MYLQIESSPVKRKMGLNCFTIANSEPFFKIANSEPLVVEEVPPPHRYRPDNLNSLCTATGLVSLSLSYSTFTFINFHFHQYFHFHQNGLQSGFTFTENFDFNWIQLLIQYLAIFCNCANVWLQLNPTLNNIWFNI